MKNPETQRSEEETKARWGLQGFLDYMDKGIYWFLNLPAGRSV
jgi:hypothetical protein